MGCWWGRGAVLACLLLLRPLPSRCCPAACRCSVGNVDCSEHGLREVPPSLATNTSTLWLGYNFITVLGPRSFPPLPGLRVLSLPHNHLGLIHSQALVGLGALQELDLSDNYLTVLSPETFLPLSNLTNLNLGGNRLRQLEPGVLQALPQLQALFLQDNPWGCSCSILPLWRWLSHNRDKVRGECPRTMTLSPPPAPCSLVTPSGLRLHPEPCCQRLWACNGECPWWYGEVPQVPPSGHGSSCVCLGVCIPGSGSWCPPCACPCSWRRGLDDVPVTGTQLYPQQWHQPHHAEGKVCLQWAPLLMQLGFSAFSPFGYFMNMGLILHFFPHEPSSESPLPARPLCCHCSCLLPAWMRARHSCWLGSSVVSPCWVLTAPHMCPLGTRPAPSLPHLPSAPKLFQAPSPSHPTPQCTGHR